MRDGVASAGVSFSRRRKVISPARTVFAWKRRPARSASATSTRDVLEPRLPLDVRVLASHDERREPDAARHERCAGSGVREEERVRIGVDLAGEPVRTQREMRRSREGEERRRRQTRERGGQAGGAARRHRDASAGRPSSTAFTSLFWLFSSSVSLSAVWSATTSGCSHSSSQCFSMTG